MTTTTLPATGRRAIPASGRTTTGKAASAPIGVEGMTHWVGAVIVLLLGMFMTVLDSSIVNVAVPTLQTEFGGSTADLAWISTAYSLTLGVIVPITAWLGDRIGLSKLFIVSLIGFGGASALCGLSWSLGSMIVFRVIQAIPGGIIPAITMTMVFKVVPKDKIGSAMGLAGIAMIGGPALGPTLGGYLVQYVSWRLIFFINVPVAVIGTVLGLRLLPRFPKAPTFRFDILGFATVAAGLVALLLATAEGASWGWTSYPVLGLLTGGVLSLALFVVIELERDHPLLNLAVFRNRAFTTSVAIIAVQTIGLYAVLFYIPVFLQSVLGMPAFSAGMVILPQALISGIVAPFAGRLFDRFGSRWLAFAGSLLAAVATWLMTGINLNTGTGEIVGWTCLRALGVALVMMPVTTGSLASLEPTLTNSGSAFNNVVQRVGAALGLAALAAFVTGQQAQLLAARGNLLPSSIAQQSQLSLASLYQFYVGVNLDVLTNAISNMLMIATGITALGILLALTLPARTKAHANQAPAAKPADRS